MKPRISHALLSKGITLVLLLLSINFLVNGQSVDSKSLVDSIRNDVKEFLIKQNTWAQFDHLSKNVYISDAVTNTPLGQAKYGIYTFVASVSHTDINLLIKKDKKYFIYDLNNLGESLDQVLIFSREQNFTNDQIFKYTGAILEAYRINASGHNREIK